MLIASTLTTKFKYLLGKDHVMTDPISLALASYDCSLSQHRPDLVLHPTKLTQLESTIGLLACEKIPFVARAAATNHAGSCAAIKGGAILDLNALKDIENIDTTQGFADVSPGTITGDLQQALAPLGFFYAPDPASERVCTLGGNLAQNASGARCLKYGNTADNVLQAEFITPDGQVHVLRHDKPGPDWLGLIAGSEGTLGIIKRLRVKILPTPKHVKTFLITFTSLENCVQTVTDLIASGLTPRCVEAMDDVTIKAIENFSHAGYPDAAALLILELDGSLATIKKDTALLEKICQQNNCKTFQAASTEDERQKLWAGRRAAYAAMAALAPNVAVADGTVPRSELPRALQQVREIISRYGLTASLLFHAGDGNFHPQLVFDSRSSVQTQLVHRALQEILKACVDCGGTISGEHGIGIEKRALMTYQYSCQTLRLFKKIKQAFDPNNLANPDKIIPVGFEGRASLYQEQDPNVLSLQQQILQRFTQKEPSLIMGANTHQSNLHTPVLSTLSLNCILEIDRTNYTATVQAGVPVPEVIRALRAQHAYAKLPVDYAGTLGGLVATKTALEFTSQIIGMQAILPNGDIVQYGGKIMKNAAGYNLCRLFAGSWGALGLITQITFKIYATPQTKKALLITQIPEPNPLFQAIKQEIDPLHLFRSAVFKEDKP